MRLPEARTGTSPRMVVLRALGLGDLCTGVPALRGLRRARPDHRVILAGPASLAPLVELSGAVDDVVDVVALDAGPLPRSAQGADLAVNLHGRGPQSSQLLAASTRQRLVAFAHPEVRATAGGPSWDEDEHEVERWCRLATHAGADADPTDLLLPAPQLAVGHTGHTGPTGPTGPTGHPVNAAAEAQPDVIVHPGAASQARRWPADRWGALVRALLDAGRHVTITGSGDEVTLAQHIAGSLRPGDDDRCTVVAGRTNVLELAGLVAAATLLVAGDTGVAHLATAFATPSVLLFGPTSPARWGPITGGPHQVLWAGRTGNPHAPVPDPGLLEITVADVLAAIAKSPTARGDVRRACGPEGGGSRR